MLSRRELLMTMGTAPLAAGLSLGQMTQAPRFEIRPELHCLSQESAAGFRLLLEQQTSSARPRRPLIVAPGTCFLSDGLARELAAQIRQGAWLLFEDGRCFSGNTGRDRQTVLLEEAFGIQVLPGLPVSTKSAFSFYVEYSWPSPTLIRGFETVRPVHCETGETIAWFGGQAICTKRAIGKGAVIYLGAMLGPSLLAEDREAHRLGAQIVNAL